VYKYREGKVKRKHEFKKKFIYFYLTLLNKKTKIRIFWNAKVK